MSTNEYQVSGMTCAHCELSVREEVEEIAGVESVEVSAATGRLVVVGNEVSEAQVLAAVTEAGYSATPQSGEAGNE